MLHICFCFHDKTGKYYKNAIVSCVSIFENTSSAICIHIVSDETLTEEAKILFLQAAQTYKQHIKFYSAADSIPPEVFTDSVKKFTKGSLYRLYLQNIIQEEVVLYLDCNIVFSLDVKELFTNQHQLATLCAVKDTAINSLKIWKPHLRKLQLGNKEYFNSGVLLMNLKRLREHHPYFPQELMRTIATTELRLPDQDALNIYFFIIRGDIPSDYCALPEKYNFCIGYDDLAYLPLANYKEKIIHYTGSKPWESLYTAGLFYWHYYALFFGLKEAFAEMTQLSDDQYIYLHRFLLRCDKKLRWVSRCQQFETEGFKEVLLDRIFPARRKRKKAAQ